MRISKSERELGKSNYERLTKYLNPETITSPSFFRPIKDRSISDLLSNIEYGFNFNDAVTETLLHQAVTIDSLMGNAIKAASLQTAPKSIPFESMFLVVRETRNNDTEFSMHFNADAATRFIMEIINNDPRKADFEVIHAPNFIYAAQLEEPSIFIYAKKVDMPKL